MSKPYFAAAEVKKDGATFYVEFRVDDGALCEYPHGLPLVTRARTIGTLIVDGFAIWPTAKRDEADAIIPIPALAQQKE